MPELLIYPLPEDQKPSASLVEATISFACFKTGDENSQAHNNRLLRAVEQEYLSPALIQRFCQHRRIEKITLTYQPTARVYQITYGQPPEIARIEISII